MHYNVQGSAELYLTTSTDLAMKQFEARFHEDNMVKAVLQVVLSDGTRHEIDVIDWLKLNWHPEL